MTKRKAPQGSDYDVGYGKPPKAGQFKKGQPRPPRKDSTGEVLDFAALVAEELAVPIRFKDEDGKDRRLPKARVLAKRLVNEALKTGNAKHLKDFFPKSSAAEKVDYSDADLALIARFLRDRYGEGGGDGEIT
jgi:hypothetical protein